MRPQMVVMPRLDRGIQYAAAHRLKHGLWILGRPVKPGDDSGARSSRALHHRLHTRQRLYQLAELGAADLEIAVLVEGRAGG